jgi:serralysin
VYDGDGNRVLGTVNGVTTAYPSVALRTSIGGYYEYQGSPEPSQVIGEVGQVTNLTDTPQTVSLERTYQNPVVFAQPLSSNGSDTAVVRITDVSANSFTFYVQEAPDRDGVHGNAETVSYMVLEAGQWSLADGRRLDVGSFTIAATVGKSVSSPSWHGVVFSEPFPQTPVVLSQIQTDNDAAFVKT